MQHANGATDAVGTNLSRPPLPSYSTCIAESITGPPQRGLVQSVFTSAANILFPNTFVLSLNIASSPRMPNGIHLPTTPPLSHLRPGMPVLLGANRLYIQPLDYILDLSSAMQWNPQIERPAQMNRDVLHNNILWLRHYLPTIYNHAKNPSLLCTGDDRWDGVAPGGRPSSSIVEIAHFLCGRGQGLTPDGDDILAGWMAMGWLLYGPQPDFLAACQHIVAIARQQTHLLSQCWLEYAARGYVAEPILALLHALTQDNRQILTHALGAVLAMGATSGYNVVQGILLEHAIYSFPST